MTKHLGFTLVLFLAVFLFAVPVQAGEATGNDAVVTMIKGTARSYAAGSTRGRSLKKGDLLKRGQEVKVAKKSRLEIRFSDGTVMRLSEKSDLKMNELSFNKQTDDKNVKVGLSVGKLWAKVKKLTTPDSSVEVRTSNAVAGVRGTVYRVNVEEDKSALVKVYDGSVYVTNPPRDTTSGNNAAAPHEVSGPHAVAPPYHEVSMEEWTAIVKAMQQISISPQGVPSKPEGFNPKADADDWVKWNQERDKDLKL
ncbi:MAG: FecR family protein [Nitrospiraceae bacterium]|nr:FecR family protein [Nitrospiraceae bacterium]